MPPIPEKRQTAEEVQWENRVAFQKGEHDRLVKAKEALQAEIDKKTADYAIHLAQRDSDSKKMRQDVLQDREQMDKDKSDFHEILKSFQAEKEAFLKGQEGSQNEKAKLEAEKNNIREFVIAVQRACSLIGL